MYHVGDTIPTWFSDRPCGLSVVIAVRPYVGRYDFFTQVVTCSAPRTARGTIEMAV